MDDVWYITHERASLYVRPGKSFLFVDDILLDYRGPMDMACKKSDIYYKDVQYINSPEKAFVLRRPLGNHILMEKPIELCV